MSVLSRSQGDRGPGEAVLGKRHRLSEWQQSLRSQAALHLPPSPPPVEFVPLMAVNAQEESVAYCTLTAPATSYFVLNSVSPSQDGGCRSPTPTPVADVPEH